jgi:hypothetical protein
MGNILLSIKDFLFSNNKDKVEEKIQEKIQDKIQDKVEVVKKFTKEERESGLDEVYFAMLDDDLDKMLSVTELNTIPKNRHYLLQSIVNQSYKLRKEEKYKNICINFSEQHLKEFDAISPYLINKYDSTLPRVSTFQNYSTLLTELGEYEKAIDICRKAISYGLKDGTKACYLGRIERIKKKNTQY